MGDEEDLKPIYRNIDTTHVRVVGDDSDAILAKIQQALEAKENLIIGDAENLDDHPEVMQTVKAALDAKETLIILVGLKLNQAIKDRVYVIE